METVKARFLYDEIKHILAYGPFFKNPVFSIHKPKNSVIIMQYGSYKHHHLNNGTFMEFYRAKIVKCEPHSDYKLWIQFDDGRAGEVNLKHLAGKGVFSVWKSIEFFNSVYIDEKTQTVAWNDGLDLDPYVLRDQIALDMNNNSD